MEKFNEKESNIASEQEIIDKFIDLYNEIDVTGNTYFKTGKRKDDDVRVRRIAVWDYGLHRFVRNEKYYELMINDMLDVVIFRLSFEGKAFTYDKFKKIRSVVAEMFNEFDNDEHRVKCEIEKYEQSDDYKRHKLLEQERLERKNKANETVNDNLDREQENEINIEQKEEMVFKISKKRNVTFHNNFKDNVRMVMDKCPVTGMTINLQHCHIKPYSDDSSNNIDRQNGYNGFLLYQGLHSLFDNGMFTFENDGTIRLSPELSELEKHIWSLYLYDGKRCDIQNDDGERNTYLKYHREDIFKDGVNNG